MKPEPPPPHEEVLFPEPERLPVMTPQPVMRRSTFCEPHAGHRLPSPAEYADIESRTSYGAPQSWQVNS